MRVHKKMRLDVPIYKKKTVFIHISSSLKLLERCGLRMILQKIFLLRAYKNNKKVKMERLIKKVVWWSV